MVTPLLVLAGNKKLINDLQKARGAVHAEELESADTENTCRQDANPSALRPWLLPDIVNSWPLSTG